MKNLGFLAILWLLGPSANASRVNVTASGSSSVSYKVLPATQVQLNQLNTDCADGPIEDHRKPISYVTCQTTYELLLTSSSGEIEAHEVSIRGEVAMVPGNQGPITSGEQITMAEGMKQREDRLQQTLAKARHQPSRNVRITFGADNSFDITDP